MAEVFDRCVCQSHCSQEADRGRAESWKPEGFDVFTSETVLTVWSQGRIEGDREHGHRLSFREGWFDGDRLATASRERSAVERPSEAQAERPPK